MHKIVQFVTERNNVGEERPLDGEPRSQGLGLTNYSRKNPRHETREKKGVLVPSRGQKKESRVKMGFRTLDLRLIISGWEQPKKKKEDLTSPHCSAESVGKEG